MINVVDIMQPIKLLNIGNQNMNYLSKFKNNIQFNDAMAEITFNGQKILAPLVDSIAVTIFIDQVKIAMNGSEQAFATIEDEDLFKVLGIENMFTPRTFDIQNIRKCFIESRQSSIVVLMLPENKQQINLTQILNDIFTELNHQYREYDRSISKKSK